LFGNEIDYKCVCKKYKSKINQRNSIDLCTAFINRKETKDDGIIHPAIILVLDNLAELGSGSLQSEGGLLDVQAKRRFLDAQTERVLLRRGGGRRGLAAAGAVIALGEELLALVVEDEHIVVMNANEVGVGLAVTTLLLVVELLGRTTTGRDIGINDQHQLNALVFVSKRGDEFVVLAGEVMLAENNGISSKRHILEVEQRAGLARVLGLLLLGQELVLLLEQAFLLVELLALVVTFLLVELLTELGENSLFLAAATAAAGGLGGFAGVMLLVGHFSNGVLQNALALEASRAVSITKDIDTLLSEQLGIAVVRAGA